MGHRGFAIYQRAVVVTKEDQEVKSCSPIAGNIGMRHLGDASVKVELVTGADG